MWKLCVPNGMGHCKCADFFMDKSGRGRGVCPRKRGVGHQTHLFRPPHAEALPNAQMQAILSFRDKMGDKT